MSQNKKSDLFYTLSVILFATLITIAIIYAWTEPTSAPPTGNVPAPINVGDSAQIKSGPLQVNGFRNTGNTILDGNVGIGTATPASKLTVAGTIETTSGGFKFPDGSVQTTATSASGGVSTRWIYNSNALQSTFSYTFPSSMQRVYITVCSSDSPSSFAIYGSRISTYTASSYARCFNEQTRGCTNPIGTNLGPLPGVDCGYSYYTPWCCGPYGVNNGGCPGSGCDRSGFMDNFYRCNTGDVCAKGGYSSSPGICCPGTQSLYRSADGYCYDSYTNVDMVKVGSCSYAEIEKRGTVNFAFDKGVNHFEITHLPK